jgi:hypothetical protein
MSAAAGVVRTMNVNCLQTAGTAGYGAVWDQIKVPGTVGVVHPPAGIG